MLEKILLKKQEAFITIKKHHKVYMEKLHQRRNKRITVEEGIEVATIPWLDKSEN